MGCGGVGGVSFSLDGVIFGSPHSRRGTKEMTALKKKSCPDTMVYVCMYVCFALFCVGVCVCVQPKPAGIGLSF